MLRKILQVPVTQSALLATPSLEQHYQDSVASCQLHYDEAQFFAIQQLQQLSEQLQHFVHYQQQSTLAKLRCLPPEKCTSLYLYGEVGGGKSLLMALFYKHCPIEKKRRVHFNIFMLEVHRFIYNWQQQNEGDTLIALAKHIRASVVLLCFDEFHVSDIADAMILGRLFKLLFDLGVTVVITSNRHPEKLYQGGLPKDKFLFFIEVINHSARIIELNAKQDYRLRHAHNEQVYYYYPLDAGANNFIKQQYKQLGIHEPLQTRVIALLGRELSVLASNTILVSNFNQLCAQALASADYLQLIAQFDTLLLSDIPQLQAEHRNEAKRFVTLIDILYEHKIKLICTAQVSADKLYLAGDGAFEFKRTVSRLIEMQSKSYMTQIL